jgi:hypothetical protein
MDSRFKQALLEAVDEGLLILGESSRKAIYFHLKNMCSLTREDVPNRPDVFVSGLERIFGAGSKAIEKSIVESLYRKLGIKYEEKKKCSFLDHLNYAMEIIQTTHFDNADKIRVY